MNLDHFLDFWSQYNQTIIQALIVVTLVFIVALVFITLFGSKSDDAGGAQVGLSPDLEKSLQKMLENQTKAAVFDFTKTQGNEAPSSVAAQAGSSAANAEAQAQMEKLKTEMAAKEKKIQELNTQLSQAAGQPESRGDTGGLEARIKELEARLAEYDIISEDIADLSRYKDENEKIKAELASLKGGAPEAIAPVTAAPPPPVDVPPAQPAPVVTPVSPVPEAVSEVQVAPATTNDASSALNAAIDDDLMKEFAAAVEGQKAATQATSAPPPSADSEDLMGQFENFVQKKEGS